MNVIAMEQELLSYKELPQFIERRAYALLQVILASCFIGFCAQISIPLYFTPVPLTGQTLAVMLTGAFLGRSKGVAATIFYLLEGSLGFPVWAGGHAGIAHILGPTGGYLLCYPLQAYFIGRFLEKKSSGKAVSTLVVSSIFQLSLGSLWLSLFTGVKSMFVMGIYPFVPGEAMKAFLVSGLISLRNRFQHQ